VISSLTFSLLVWGSIVLVALAFGYVIVTLKGVSA